MFARIHRALVLALLLGMWVAAPARAAGPLASPVDAPASFEAGSAYLYVPSNVDKLDRPLQVVFALHGMGGEGKGFCQAFLSAAERNHWLVVAPTFTYRNWKDPAIVAEDDIALTGRMVELLDSLPRRVGHATTNRAILFGFSRGAQLAHRFAMAYPDRTRAVAAMSAGTYTLPRAIDGEATDSALNFPYGTADLARRTGHTVEGKALAKVPFWVAVGADDNRVEDVPRQWDRLLGRNRVQRAAAFVRELTDWGVRASLAVYPSLGHGMSADMVRGATAFMAHESGSREAPPIGMTDYAFTAGAI